MKNLKVSNRYAKALWGLAKENDIIEKTFNDMKLVFQVLSENKELKTLLSSPIVRISKKQNILKLIFEENIHSITLHYIQIIVRKKRAVLLEGIAFEYLKIYRDNLDIESVTLIIADELDDVNTQRALEISHKITSKSKIEFQKVVKPEIIGGFILRVGDLQYDASVRKKFFNLRKELS